MKIYTLYMQKGKDDRRPFMVQHYLNQFLRLTQANSIVLSPGYTGTSSANIDKLLHATFDRTNVNNFGTLNDMHNLTHSDYYSIVSHVLPSLKLIDLNINGNKEHRKMAFVFNTINNSCNQCSITRHCVEHFISNINVIGVLIGSSNFSKITYLGNSSGVADKGEADILMFNNDATFNKFKEWLIENSYSENINNFNNAVLSENVTPVNDDFLTDIFRKTLLQSLL